MTRACKRHEPDLPRRVHRSALRPYFSAAVLDSTRATVLLLASQILGDEQGQARGHVGYDEAREVDCAAAGGYRRTFPAV